MQLDNSRKNEMPRSHRDRHPGLIDALDNPHPQERRQTVTRGYARVSPGREIKARGESPR